MIGLSFQGPNRIKVIYHKNQKLKRTKKFLVFFKIFVFIQYIFYFYFKIMFDEIDKEEDGEVYYRNNINMNLFLGVFLKVFFL